MTNTQTPAPVVGKTYRTTSGRRLRVLNVTEAQVFYDALTPEGNRTFVTHWCSPQTFAMIAAEVEA